MPKLHPTPTVIEACGTKPKIIKEFIGRVNSADPTLSIAHMTSPSGWEEPGQRPDFDEYTLVISGALHVTSQDGTTMVVQAGQAVTASKGEWVQYSTPDEAGAEYIAVCLPAFTPESVHRDGS